MAHAPLKPPPTLLLELSLGAAWLIGLAAILQLLTALIGQSPLAVGLAGAVIADVVSSRAGVRWDDALDPAEPGYRARIARRIGVGAGLGAVAAGVTVLGAVALGWVRLAPGHVSLGLGFALVRAVAVAVRDELLLTGIAFTAAARAGVSSRFALAFAALAHGAAIALAPGAGAPAFVLATASGALSAALWQRYRGAWAAVAASASWTLLAGTGLRGGFLDATWTDGALALGARAFGPPAWLAAIVLAVLALRVGSLGRAPAVEQEPPRH